MAGGGGSLAGKSRFVVVDGVGGGGGMDFAVVVVAVVAVEGMDFVVATAGGGMPLVSRAASHPSDATTSVQSLDRCIVGGVGTKVATEMVSSSGTTGGA